MTSWSISIDGVRAVLAAVAEDGEAITAAGSAWSVAAGSAVATISAPSVRRALSSAVDERLDVPDRVAAAVRLAAGAASDATTAYLDGDEEMAANATTRASASGAWSTGAPPAGVDLGLWRAQ